MAANIASVTQDTNDILDRQAAKRRLGTIGYGLSALAVVFGWIFTRDSALVDPINGLGYWLGIVGASLMAVLLLYPIRKRVRMLSWLGATRHWFQLHIVFGVVGPILILYHCNFRLGSLNSNVALVCTLLVAGSGLIGRYLHSKVYSGLDGHRTSLQELVNRAQLTSEQQARASSFAPKLIEQMRKFDSQVLAPPHGFFACLLLPCKLALSTRVGFLRLAWQARREIKRSAAAARIDTARRKAAQSTVTRFIATHLRRVRRVAEFHSYERLFSLWHIFHLPIFYILIFTALMHVLAVHMY